jgi:hypothetical protein
MYSVNFAVLYIKLIMREWLDNHLILLSQLVSINVPCRAVCFFFEMNQAGELPIILKRR